MTRMRWDRPGPARPGSSSMDHPRGIERPASVANAETDQERRARRKQEHAERGRAIKAAEWDARFGTDRPNPYRSENS
jgi:hypothetical protein